MNNSFIYSVSHFFIRFFLKVLFRFKAIGVENVPSKGAFLLASNHISFLDPLIVGSAITNRQLSYMARATLFKNKYFSWLISKWHVFPVTRETADRGAFKKIFELLKAGAAVLLFPEGTRSPDGGIKPFKRGIGFVALQANVPIIPIYIYGSYKALPRGAKILKLTPIFVYFGEAISTESFRSLPQNKNTTELLSNEIMRRIVELELLAKKSND